MPATPFFQPWCGERYSSGVGGRRLLLLGESHYATDTRDAYPRLTIDIVSRVMRGEHFPFFTKTQTILEQATGHVFDWAQVAFYNFVQELVGAHARDRPTPAMWKDAVPAFHDTLYHLKPNAVLVLGVSTWNQLSLHWPPWALSESTSVGQQVRTWRYPQIDPIVATWVNHPASFGFRAEEWVERVVALLTEARRPSANAAPKEPCR